MWKIYLQGHILSTTGDALTSSPRTTSPTSSPRTASSSATSSSPSMRTTSITSSSSSSSIKKHQEQHPQQQHLWRGPSHPSHCLYQLISKSICFPHMCMHHIPSNQQQNEEELHNNHKTWICFCSSIIIIRVSSTNLIYRKRKLRSKCNLQKNSSS